MNRDDNNNRNYRNHYADFNEDGSRRDRSQEDSSNDRRGGFLNRDGRRNERNTDRNTPSNDTERHNEGSRDRNYSRSTFGASAQGDYSGGTRYGGGGSTYGGGSSYGHSNYGTSLCSLFYLSRL